MADFEHISGGIARKVYRLHIALVRKINDTHIFATQALQVLRDAQAGGLTDRREGKDRRYDVPSVRKGKFARRKAHEIKQIYSRFLTRELFENFIIAGISQLESFLFDTLRLILTAYPHKLKINLQGLEVDRTVPLDLLLGKEDLQGVIKEIIEDRIATISYASPRAYLQFLAKVADINVKDKAFEHFLEIKATRDILIHSSGIVNSIYIQKAGSMARAQLGETIPIDQKYFDHCVATIKRISGIVRRDVEKAFPERKSASTSDVQPESDGPAN